MTNRVECYAGGSYPEKPRAVIWERQRYTVEAIHDQRLEPDGIGFRVLCQPDETIFDLFYSIILDTWEIRLIGPSPEGQLTQPN